MTITYNEIPQALRYPGAYIEIDGSQAGLGSGLPAVLLVGLRLPSGTAPAGEVVRIGSVRDAQIKAGAGSMLAQMAASYRKVDQTFDLYMLPFDDESARGSMPATGSIEVLSSPTSDGVLSLYIAQRAVGVQMWKLQTPYQNAQAIAQAINAWGDDMPVTASSSDGLVVLTAKQCGLTGSDIDLRLNLYGETMPEGMTVSINAMTGGSLAQFGSSFHDSDTFITLLEQQWFRYVVLGINDQITIAAWHNASQRRYKPPVQAGFRIFAAHRGDYLTAAQFGSFQNCEHITMLSLGINPTTTWEAAATVAAAAAPKLYNNPVMSLEGTPLPGLVGVSYHDWTQANSLLYSGMSVMEVARDGSCYIKRLISMYQHRSDGSADDAYLDINVAEVMERIRYEQRMGAIQRFRGTVAAKTDEGFRPGLPITTEDSVRAFLLSLYKHTLMAEYGWVQGYDYYKDSLIVEQDPQNPSRFNFRDNPVVNSPFYILAGRAVFRKAVPTY